MNDETIAFVGTGVMGSSMAGHLLAAGYPLRIHTRTRERAEPLLGQGAAWCDSPAEAMTGSTVAITMVGYPEDVDRVYRGEGGLLDAAAPGSLLIDMTTSQPDLAVELARVAQEQGCAMLDAPVSGGDVGAREARLSIMVGGETVAFQRALPLLETMGVKIVHQGPAGAGQHTKMANQIAVAASMVGACEALAYARAAGLQPATVLESITEGAAGSWTLTHLAPRILDRDYAPGFYVKHFRKDLGICLDSCRRLGLDLPGVALAARLYERLAVDCPDADAQGTQALDRLYARQIPVE